MWREKNIPLLNETFFRSNYILRQPLRPPLKEASYKVDQQLLVVSLISGAGISLHFILSSVFFNNVKNYLRVLRLLE